MFRSVRKEQVGRLGHAVWGSVPVGEVGASPWMMRSCPRVWLGDRVPFMMWLREGGEQELEPEAREEVSGSRRRGEVGGSTLLLNWPASAWRLLGFPSCPSLLSCTLPSLLPSALPPPFPIPPSPPLSFQPSLPFLSPLPLPSTAKVLLPFFPQEQGSATIPLPSSPGGFLRSPEPQTTCVPLPRPGHPVTLCRDGRKQDTALRAEPRHHGCSSLGFLSWLQTCHSADCGEAMQACRHVGAGAHRPLFRLRG